MVTSYRLFKSKFADSWFDGEGAYLYGGRWNSPGIRMLYTGESLALTVLEILVNLKNEKILQSYSFAALNFDESLIQPIEKFTKLPKNWNLAPYTTETQAIGDSWVANNSSAVLRVPTAIIPLGYNYIVNVEHPDFAKIDIGVPQTFSLDKRLIPAG